MINKQHNLIHSIVVVLILISLISPGCGLFKPLKTGISGSALERIQKADYPEFSDDMDYVGISEALGRSIQYLENRPEGNTYQLGEDSYSAHYLAETLRFFLEFVQTRPGRDELNAFIKSSFIVYGSTANHEGDGMLFTGYYEPTLSGSLEKSPEYPYPVYGLPKDAAFIDLSKFGISGINKKRLVGRFTKNQTIVPYYTRKEIKRIASKIHAKPLAWVKDEIDLFFLEIQGSGKIILKSGETMNVHYMSSNGRPYRSIGALLVREGKISKKEISMQSIKSYLVSHPDEREEILNHNPSYVFFQIEDDGPLGCYNFKITPGRSIALQKRIFPAACLGFMESSRPLVDESGSIKEWTNFRRFVVNQDTGGAIRGPGRADLFWGGASYAETAAGHMQHPGKLFFLVIKPKIFNQREYEIMQPQDLALDSSTQNTYK